MRSGWKIGGLVLLALAAGCAATEEEKWR